jgi:hypothetical protein
MTDEERFERMGCLITVDDGNYEYDIGCGYDD